MRPGRRRRAVQATLTRLRDRRSWAGVSVLLVSLLAAWWFMSREPPAPAHEPVRIDLVVLPTGNVDELVLSTRIRCTEQLLTDRCRLLRSLNPRDLLIRPGAVCSAQYGGPAKARVSGYWRGVTFEETFTLADGCQIARWKHWQVALGLPRL